MATTLPTDYVDAQLKSGETLKKYNQIDNDDGTVSFQDVTEYEVVGSKHTAAAVNAQNKIINELNPTVYTATLSANATEVSFTDVTVSDDSKLFLYGKDTIVHYTDISISDTTVTYTVTAQDTDVEMKLEVY